MENNRWRRALVSYIVAGINIWSLDIDKQNPSVLYAGSFSETFSTVYRTTDGGDNWSPIHRGLTDEDLWSIKVHPADSNVVWVAGSSDTSGIFHCNNRERILFVLSAMQLRLIQ